MGKQYNTELQAKVETYMKETGISQAKLAPMMNLSGAVLSQYRRSVYDKGDVGDVERKIREFFQIKEEQAENAKKTESFNAVRGYVATSISESIYKMIRYCQLEKGIVVIDGDAGIGKTKAATKFLRDNPATAIYISTTPSTSSVRSLYQLKDNPKFEEWKKRYVKEKAKEPAEPLTDAEQHAMNSYISSSSYVWNDKLRRGEKLTKQEEQSIKAMDSALQKMPKYEGTVKRSLSDFGILDVDEFVESYVPGELKIFNEYLSSSTEVYDDSFQIQYVIQSKNGRDIRKYNSTEKEILFERGSSFIVTRVDGHTIYMEEL